MRLPYITFFIVFASILFVQGQDNSRSGAQLMMEGIIQQRKAKEACEIQDFITAHKLYDEALSIFSNAKKAFENDKTGKEKAKQQIDLIRKEKEDCRPRNSNAKALENGAKTVGASGLVFQKSSGTGGIVGHIANITVSNLSDNELIVCFSNLNACPANAMHVGMMYIPNEDYQDYIVFGPLDFIIPANSTFIIPVTGVCVQPDKDPVPDAFPFSKPESWILESDPGPKFSTSGVNAQNKESGLYVANVKDVWPEIPFLNTDQVIVESGKNRPLSAALIFDAIQKIDSTILVLNNRGSFQRTLFEKNQANSDMMIKLYSAWYYVGTLTGTPYTYDDFESGIFAQIDPNVMADPTDRMSIISESKKFWEQVMMTVKASGVLSSAL